MGDLGDLCVQCCLVFTMMSLYITYVTWLSIIFPPSDRYWETEAEVETLAANTPLSIPQPCNNNNWSAGSALFTLTALTLGYISHPRGCMVFNRSGRMWRLSPLFALFETCLLWTGIISSALKKTGPSFRVVCHALMAVRISNSWHPFEMREALRPEQRHDVRAEEGRLLPQEHAEQRGTPAQPAPEADLTWDQRERLRQGRVFAARDKIIRKALEEVAKFEHGPSYRIFIWIPMVLQIVKLLVVSGSGSHLTKLFGWVYIISWASIEGLMIISAQRPLEIEERTSAISLCLEWTNEIEWYESEFKWKDDSALPEGLRIAGWIFAGLSGIYNTFFTLDLLFHNFVLSDSYVIKPRGLFSSLGFSIERIAIMIAIALVYAVAGFLVAYPWLMLLGQIIFLRVWKVFGRVTKMDFGPLWFKSYSLEVMPLVPAHIAMYTFVVMLLFHTGFRWWHPFECWETRQPWFYDWLG